MPCAEREKGRGGRKPGEDEGRDQSGSATCQGLQKIAGKPPEGRHGTQSLL